MQTVNTISFSGTLLKMLNVTANASQNTMLPNIKRLPNECIVVVETPNATQNVVAKRALNQVVDSCLDSR